MDTCFTYKANPASYNPRLSEFKCLKTKNSLILQIQNVFSCSHQCWPSAAISYSVESDGDRRKQGLPSRVTFLNYSHSETEYQFNGTLDLRSQKQDTCINIMAKLKVQHFKDLMYSESNFSYSHTLQIKKPSRSKLKYQTLCGTSPVSGEDLLHFFIFSLCNNKRIYVWSFVFRKLINWDLAIFSDTYRPKGQTVVSSLM